METLNNILEKQKVFFNSGITRDVDFRIKKLKELYLVIKSNGQDIADALKKDLNKDYFESYESEIGTVFSEIRYTLKHIRKWSKTEKVKTPLMHFFSKSYIYKEPYGVVLIMSPWNYPFYLSIIPLIGAVCAGNCCILKTSQYSGYTSSVIENIINKVFPPEYVTVVQGGREANSELLKLHFDYIFFTGSSSVGHIVMEAAAKYLTPVTLELGGKSPCIVDSTANIDIAAGRIVWGKFLNAGQTCVAPDYILVQDNIKKELIEKLKYYINKYYGDNPVDAEYFPEIINEKHYKRLLGLMDSEKIVFGGKHSDSNNKIAPVIMDNVSWDDPVMKEEIFGPLLPVLTFKNYNDVISLLKSREKPLALYLFTNDKKAEENILNSISFGGGCINDTLIHLANSRLPFGGIGASGMGNYHGKYSFDTFSHSKSIIKKYNFIDITVRNPPFDNKLKFLKKILK